MRIISNFKDYYDGAGYIDPNIIYTRKTQTFDDKHIEYKTMSKDFEKILYPNIKYMNFLKKDKNGNRLFDNLEWGLAGIAGTIRHFLMYEPVDRYDKNDCVKFYYNCDTFLKNYPNRKYKNEPNIKEQDVEKALNIKPKSGYLWGGFWKNSWIELDDYIKQFSDHIMENIFIKYNTPIFAMIPVCNTYGRKHTIKINPCLKDINFQTQMDPVTVFQTISRFISNDLVKQIDPDDTIPNDVKIHKHGFDKLSFRKQSNKNK